MLFCSSDSFFIIKGNANNGRNPPSSPFPFSLATINEEATGCINVESIGTINEPAIGAIIAPINPSCCFFILCFTVLVVVPSNNRSNFSIESTILIISSISSIEINKVNLFPTLAVPCQLFLKILSNTEEVTLVDNLGKTSLAKGTAQSNNTFFTNNV